MREAEDRLLLNRDYEWGEEFAELTLLLPFPLLEALESEASDRRVTSGQLLRRLIFNLPAGLKDTLSSTEPMLHDAEALPSDGSFPREAACKQIVAPS